jgi:hypothetical protein
MKGPLFYSKILLFGEYGIIVTQRIVNPIIHNGALKK